MWCWTGTTGSKNPAEGGSNLFYVGSGTCWSSAVSFKDLATGAWQGSQLASSQFPATCSSHRVEF